MSEHSEEMTRYIAAVHTVLSALFMDEERREEMTFDLLPHFDLEGADLTLFITAIPYAVNIFLRQYAGQKLDHLEMTYMLNRLVYQYEKGLAVKAALAEQSEQEG